jgi:hypothetical protein
MNAVIYTAAAVYSFYLVPIVVFSSVCIFLIYGVVTNKPTMALVTVAIVVLGGFMYRASKGGRSN